MDPMAVPTADSRAGALCRNRFDHGLRWYRDRWRLVVAMSAVADGQQ
jgi:hypothetical protein